LEEKRRSLEQAIQAIREAEDAIASGNPAGTQVLARIIEAIKMQENAEFMNQYYSPDAQAKLAEKRKPWTPELQAEATRAWTGLFRDIEAALGEDPQSAKAPALAARWRKLVEGFTGGDPDLARGDESAERALPQSLSLGVQSQSQRERITAPRHCFAARSFTLAASASAPAASPVTRRAQLRFRYALAYDGLSEIALSKSAMASGNCLCR